MPFWPWLRIREGLRWLFRGTAFQKLERDIDRMAAPLARAGMPARRANRLRRRIRHAISWLPPERGERFHDTMARYGHSVR